MNIEYFLGAFLGIGLGFSILGVIAAIKICDWLRERIDILSKRVDDLTFRK